MTLKFGLLCTLEKRGLDLSQYFSASVRFLEVNVNVDEVPRKFSLNHGNSLVLVLQLPKLDLTMKM